MGRYGGKAPIRAPKAAMGFSHTRLFSFFTRPCDIP